MPIGSIPFAAWMVLTLTTTARTMNKAHPNPLRRVFLLARNAFMHLLLGHALTSHRRLELHPLPGPNQRFAGVNQAGENNFHLHLIAFIFFP
jgi:hypothetical protein